MKNLILLCSVFLLSLTLLSCHKDDANPSPTPANDTALSSGYWRLMYMKDHTPGQERTIYRPDTYKTVRGIWNSDSTEIIDLDIQIFPLPEMAYTIYFTYDPANLHSGTFKTRWINAMVSGEFNAAYEPGKPFIVNYKREVPENAVPSEFLYRYIDGTSYSIDKDGHLNVFSYENDAYQFVFEKRF